MNTPWIKKTQNISLRKTSGICKIRPKLIICWVRRQRDLIAFQGPCPHVGQQALGSPSHAGTGVGRREPGLGSCAVELSAATLVCVRRFKLELCESLSAQLGQRCRKGDSTKTIRGPKKKVYMCSCPEAELQTEMLISKLMQVEEKKAEGNSAGEKSKVPLMPGHSQWKISCKECFSWHFGILQIVMLRLYWFLDTAAAFWHLIVLYTCSSWASLYECNSCWLKELSVKKYSEREEMVLLGNEEVTAVRTRGFSSDVLKKSWQGTPST